MRLSLHVSRARCCDSKHRFVTHPVCPAPVAKPLFSFSVLPLALGMSAATAAHGSPFLVPSRSSRPSQNSVGGIGSKGISGKCSLQKWQHMKIQPLSPSYRLLNNEIKKSILISVVTVALCCHWSLELIFKTNMDSNYLWSTGDVFYNKLMLSLFHKFCSKKSWALYVGRGWRSMYQNLRY